MGDDELTTIARTGIALLSIGIFVLLSCRQSLAMHFLTYRAIILGDPNCFVPPFGTVEITL